MPRTTALLPCWLIVGCAGGAATPPTIEHSTPAAEPPPVIGSLAPAPMHGPFVSIASWCALAPPGCLLEEVRAIEGQTATSFLEGPFREARLVAVADERRARCHLGLRTPEGWWFAPAGFECATEHHGWIDLQVLDFTTDDRLGDETPELILTTVSGGQSCGCKDSVDLEQTMLCGIGARGPACTPSILVRWTTFGRGEGAARWRLERDGTLSFAVEHADILCEAREVTAPLERRHRIVF
jgi:hypothetical protein